MKQTKLITILGPTASGKTRWSLDLAHFYGGEVVSADSRQIYRYMDIGTAKEPGRHTWHMRRFGLPFRSYDIEGVRHSLIDFLDPKRGYTVAEFQVDATKRLKNIAHRKKLPLLVGGTGLYLQAVIDGYHIPDVTPDENLRAVLEKKSLEELSVRLNHTDPAAFAHVDKQNKRRLIRAIELAESGRSITEAGTSSAQFHTLQIGIHVQRDVLYTRINERVDRMVRDGLVDEIQMLLDRGYTWDLSSMSGVGYRQFQPYIEGTASLGDCIETLKRDTRRYAKRQMTWFKRDSRILWCQSYEEAVTHVERFLSK